MQAQKIIVIHPGSLYLRIGRASDLNPITVLHAIGRRRKDANDPKLRYNDPLLPSTVIPANDEQSSTMQEFEESRLQVSHAIQAHATQNEDRGSKRLRIATPPQQIATFNRRSVPEELPLLDTVKNEDAEKKVELEDGKQCENLKDNIFDEDILKLNDKSEYNVHFPMKRGEFNTHRGVGGSLSAVLSDLQAIWLHVIEDRMSIPRRSLEEYRAVLVINDVYQCGFLRELITLLLQRIEFRGCFLVQDHVASTFGAGLGYACVVDVGDQKCSISCVEDGISQPDTRVRLGYGSGDVTRVFLTLLKKCSFPYKECNVDADYADATLIQNLKEMCCHLNLEICGAQEKMFEIKKQTKRLRYNFQLGDECVVAPLSLFNTELMNITGKKKLVRIQSHQSDSEDAFDLAYIRETARFRRADQQLEGVMPITGDTPDEELVVVDNYDVEDRYGNVRNLDREGQLYYSSGSGQILPIDLAIVRSIERCLNDDMKRKMYGSILLVGGGSKLNGLSKWLEQKIMLHIRSGEQFDYEVNVCVKEMDASMIAWKGASIMSCLESAAELWILTEEYNKYGLRILRERATFMW